jgi:hypothetical protein
MVPAPERFGAGQPQILLAFADPSPTVNGPFSSLLTGQLEEDLDDLQDPNLDMGEDAAALPGEEDPAYVVPLPQPRPRGDEGRKPAAETDKTKDRQVEEPTAPKTDERNKAEERQSAKPRQFTYGRPNEPSDGRPNEGAENRTGGGFGRPLRSIFGGGAKAGNGVAVYDIKAAKVYMPDGSVLEAHSGIGKMADNPRYIDVKMKGPTPPHTYDLKLREKRFHGVEALRMLPVDGKNRNGRNGLLAHSYLLRGGREESHGCVAFKDYQRFLSAFKKGKVKQLVVVASGGRSSVRMASAD